ncbi:MAG: PEP-CTERM sorting domain-containing protein [Myxococcota bacterium]|nr:PEP-CTERM sorting domain-containing protein [Myxococcota bacterium]
MFRIKTGLAAAAVLLWASYAGALTINWSALPDQTAGLSISQVDQETGSTLTATGSGWGGVTNPQNTLNPGNPIGSGFTQLGVNIGGGAPGSGAFSTHGLGCGTTLISQCDLISPGGEDILLIEFDKKVTVGSFIASAVEDFDDITSWVWDGSAWVNIGSDSCGLFSFCGGEEPVSAGPHAPSRFFMLVAEDSDASAFKLTRIEGVIVAEPATLGLLTLGMAGACMRRRRG